MAEIQLLGLFQDVGQAASAIDQLYKLGLKDDQIQVLSNIPYHHRILGRPKSTGLVGRMALIGSILGMLAAIGLVAGTGQLYPINQGNQSIIPIPPMLIVTFEITMLGTMWMAFLGMLISNRFPKFKKQAYDPQISEDSIGVLVEMDERLTDDIKKIFIENNASKIQKETAGEKKDAGMIRFWAGLAMFLVLGGGITGLFLFDIFRIGFPSQMVEQESIAPQQGPRLAAPLGVIPVQGKILDKGQPSASQPVASSPVSLQRGQVLYGINCELCHGAQGLADGPQAQYFLKKPADLSSSQIQNLADDDIYMVIYYGFGIMPSLAENLDPQDGWDVINYTRTLKK
jgi:mono/diheme cytochrome c family protein